MFEEHCCHHTFPRIAASIQPNPRSIQVSIHPWLISPHDSDQMSQRSQFSADALWQSRDADRIEIWKCDGRTYGLTSDMGRCRDTCVSKKGKGFVQYKLFCAIILFTNMPPHHLPPLLETSHWRRIKLVAPIEGCGHLWSWDESKFAQHSR